jgi:hypothetical protein
VAARSPWNIGIIVVLGSGARGQGEDACILRDTSTLIQIPPVDVHVSWTSYSLLPVLSVVEGFLA